VWASKDICGGTVEIEDRDPSLTFPLVRVRVRVRVRVHPCNAQLQSVCHITVADSVVPVSVRRPRWLQSSVSL
jgi:hypothetical protein